MPTITIGLALSFPTSFDGFWLLVGDASALLHLQEPSSMSTHDRMIDRNILALRGDRLMVVRVGQQLDYQSRSRSLTPFRVEQYVQV